MISLMRPLLPTTDRLLPYLRRIDASKRYTNFGPLLGEFEMRLAEHFSLGAANVACVSSGTMGLQLALQSFDIPRGSRCALPSWTFPATASAVCAAGLEPWFIDVDQDTWALNPTTLANTIAASDRQVAAVVTVVPFGGLVDVAVWDSISDALNLPVVIDAAAAFDSLVVGRSPAVVSLHATKSLGIGEGGFVVSHEEDRITRVRRDSNFGFVGGGQVETIGINAKLSEYGAALGLAALDEWPQKRAAFSRLAAHYAASLRNINGIQLAPNLRDGYVSSTFNIDLGGPVAVTVQERLAVHGIETRRWWFDGCARKLAFAGFPAEALPVSDRLAQAVLGMPYHLDLYENDVVRICEMIQLALDPPN